MKVAIMIPGHLRAWNKVKESFIQTFGHYNPDIYVDTYYETNCRGVIKTLTKEEITNMFSGLNVITLNIDKTEDVINSLKEDAKKYYIPNSHTTLEVWTGIYAQMWKIEHVNKLRIASGKTYDIVVKTRPELSYPQPVELEKLVGKNHLATSYKHTSCDLFAAGVPHLVNAFCACFSEVPWTYNHCRPSQIQMTLHIILHYTLARKNAGRGPGIDVTRN